jgi:hypothetical protein
MEAHWKGKCNSLMVMWGEMSHGTSYLDLSIVPLSFVRNIFNCIQYCIYFNYLQKYCEKLVVRSLLTNNFHKVQRKWRCFIWTHTHIQGIHKRMVRFQR